MPLPRLTLSPLTWKQLGRLWERGGVSDKSEEDESDESDESEWSVAPSCLDSGFLRRTSSGRRVHCRCPRLSAEEDERIFCLSGCLHSSPSVCFCLHDHLSATSFISSRSLSLPAPPSQLPPSMAVKGKIHLKHIKRHILLF